MIKQLVYFTDPSISSGGFADRISGMAALQKLARSFSCEFKIHFQNPFDFFKVFPKKEHQCKFDPTKINKNNVVHFNLIDDSFNNGINNLGKARLNNSEIIALVSINNIKPFIFNVLINEFAPIKYNPTDLDIIEREILYSFGNEFLIPEYTDFNSNFKDLLPKFSKPTLGIQIRVGGQNENWIDPAFKIPEIEKIIEKVHSLNVDFKQIFICSDDLKLKKIIMKNLENSFELITFEHLPLHVDRSKILNEDFISNSIGDHCLLRLCQSGVIIGGGGYGRTAAILSGAKYYRL